MTTAEKTIKLDGAINAPATSTTTEPIDHPSAKQFSHPSWRNRLSNKLLLLIALSVIVAEVLIFVPSVANMRENWLSTRIHAVEAVSEILAADSYHDIPEDVQNRLLEVTKTKSLAVQDDGTLRALAKVPDIGQIDKVIDLDNTSRVKSIWDAFSTLFYGGNRNLLVYGRPSSNENPDRIVEVILPDTALRKAMLQYAYNVAIITLLLSIIAASLIYLVIHKLLLRPVRSIHSNMIDFAANPDNPCKILVPEKRNDEFGVAQRQIAHIQSDLQNTLKEQKHLADLGLAVSKINHDMRNILASAQLMSDRLSDTDDPMVQRFAPKLIHTLNRAINYSESVIAYGRSHETPPTLRRIPLNAIIIDICETLNMSSHSRIKFENKVTDDFEINVDPEQMFRVLSNLCRNAVEAMERDKTGDQITIKRLTISAHRIGTTTIIDIEDTGPGLPQKARDNLFKPFKGSARSDGTGLGLAIAQELVHAHHGTIELKTDRPVGAHFEIRLPDLSGHRMS